MRLISRIKALASNLSTLSNPEPWLVSTFGGGGHSIAGRHVTPESAMRTSAVYACVSLLAQSMGSLPLTLHERKADGNVVPAVTHPLYSLLKSQFNQEMTAAEGRELLMTSLCLRGTAYHYLRRNAYGEIVGIHPLMFDWVRMDRDAAGNLIYRYTPPNGEAQVYTRGEVWRVIGLSMNGLQGLTPIQCAREAIGLALAVEEHGARLFSNGAQVPVVAKHPGKLSPEAAARLTESLKGRLSGNANAWKIPVLEEGMDLERIGLTAEDSQFIESRKFQIEEVARWFRAPLHLIGSLDRSTNNNIEHQGMDFVTHTLMPYAVRIEQSAERDMLHPSERGRYFLKHNFAGLLRADTLSRYKAYQLAVGGPFMSPNEARDLEEMNRIEGGDVLLKPLNMGGVSGDEGEGKSE